jgi:dTMP kinase
MTKLICVTGPDGSGKSTQVARLTEALERDGKRVAVVTIWDLLLDPSCRGKVMFDEPSQVDKYMRLLDPTSRALFIYHGLHEAVVMARRRQADVLLLNAYWYKYYATEVAHGGDRTLLRQLARIFPEPALTFYLKVAPEQAFDRKGQVSGYECGYPAERTLDAFVRFQRVAHAELDALADELRWVPVNGNAPMAELTDVLAGRIGKVV